jgi:diguanylate cyclase (GGDEF)-like protein
MTSDMSQHQQAAYKKHPGLKPTGKAAPLSVVGDADDSNLARTIGVTMGLLRRAQAVIEKAEHKISAQNERIRILEDLATVDALTGLSNRRGFDFAFIQETARVRRGHTEAGLVVVIEVDNLKTVRGLYGESAADDCLKFIARILEGETRIMDKAARVGQNAFAVLFSNTATDVALERTQKLAVRLNNLSLIRRGREIAIHTSISLKAFNEFDTAHDLFEAMDFEAIQDSPSAVEQSVKDTE